MAERIPIEFKPGSNIAEDNTQFFPKSFSSKSNAWVISESSSAASGNLVIQTFFFGN